MTFDLQQTWEPNRIWVSTLTRSLFGSLGDTTSVSNSNCLSCCLAACLHTTSIRAFSKPAADLHKFLGYHWQLSTFWFIRALNCPRRPQSQLWIDPRERVSRSSRQTAKLERQATLFRLLQSRQQLCCHSICSSWLDLCLTRSLTVSISLSVLACRLSLSLPPLSL